MDREAILRLTALLADVGAYPVRLLNKSITGDMLKKAWSETEDALRFAIDFLTSECTVPRSAVLTSPNIAIVPAFLLHARKNRLGVEEIRALRRWVYTATAFSHYSSQVEGKIEIEARLIKTRVGGELFDELIRRATGPRSVDSPVSPDDLRYKDASSSFFNFLYIAALRNGARDWCSNALVQASPMSSSASIEYHHIFPRAKVAKRFPKDKVNSLANLAFISAQFNKKIGAKLPEVYLANVKEERLREQWVPTKTSAWKITEFESFLDRRRTEQASALNALLGLPQYTPEQNRDPVAAEVSSDDDTIDDVQESDL